MANRRHLEILNQGVSAWNDWRKEQPHIKPNLSEIFRYNENLTGANLSRANLRKVNLGRANLSGADLSGAVLSDATLEGAILIRADLSDTDLTEADFHYANLSNADLSRAKLLGVNFIGANLVEANLKDAYLSRADLHEAELGNANLIKADLSESNLSDADFHDANLSGAYLSDSNLEGADFAGANLNGANISRANLLCTDFSNTSLIGANFEHATFGMTKVNGADFRKAFLTLEDEDTIGFLGLCFSQGLETARFSKATFLRDYLSKAFEYAHKPYIREELDLPDFLDDAISNISAIRSLYIDQQPPKHLIKAIGVITSELIDYLKKHPRAMYEIKPRQFEELIAEILASYGWQVNLTPATRDGGYDIYAISPVSGNETTSWIIECKKNSPNRKVGIDIVRALYGLRADLKVANALLATTSYFSRDAHAYKASRYDLKLKDYGNILEWINDYRPNPDGKLYIKDNKLIMPND